MSSKKEKSLQKFECYRSQVSFGFAGWKMSEDGDFDDDGWRPPTEAELKVIEARRERSDKISKIMGQYLLKGHKMLDQTCPRCTCILLQLKGTSDLHCVSCIDLDSESKKDDPALKLVFRSY